MLALVTTAVLSAVNCSDGHAATNRISGLRSHATGHHSLWAGAHRAHAAIVGGHFARAGQFPWLARVFARRGRVTDACSGTVVAADLILTAGHCVEDLQSGIAYAATEFEVRTTAGSGGQPAARTSRVSGVLAYPGFDRRSGVGDVALLQLSTPTTAPPIALAGEAEAWPSGTPALMAGWGRTGAATQTPFLRWARTVVQSPQWCASRLRGFHLRRQVCVMNAPRDNTAGCVGDSGGPLLVERGNATIEIGVLDGSVVRGSKTIRCLTNEPTVYANSSVIFGWVNEWIQRLTVVPVTVTETVSAMA
jgi:secreted trypsin-like serine protease